MSNQAILVAKDLAKTYGQGPTAVEVLKSIDLQVMSSEKVAIVGSSGSGKSTLLHLLGGLDSPSSGSVTLAGSNLNHLAVNKLDQLRNHSLGFIYQFHHLLDEFSAVENVALLLRIRGLSNDESMERASKMLKAVGLAARELHTPGELSGGERQRISIARALLINPRILILDEATASVDTETEQEIQKALDNLVKGRTTIAIAHRLSTLNQADRLVVMEQGVVVEEGDHDTLMARQGAYYRLYEAQAKNAEDAVARASSKESV